MSADQGPHLVRLTILLPLDPHAPFTFLLLLNIFLLEVLLLDVDRL